MKGAKLTIGYQKLLHELCSAFYSIIEEVMPPKLIKGFFLFSDYLACRLLVVVASHFMFWPDMLLINESICSIVIY